MGSEYAMAVIDEYSCYPVVEIVSSTSTNAIFPRLDSVFDMLGVPKVVKSDNGPPFNSWRSGEVHENIFKRSCVRQNIRNKKLQGDPSLYDWLRACNCFIWLTYADKNSIPFQESI